MLGEPSIEQLIRLANRAPSPPDEELVGTTDNILNAFESRTGVLLPPQFRTWLLVANGATLGPGGLFGVRNVKDFLSIEGILRIYPNWRDNGWIPIASDGVGNYWVVARGPDRTRGWVAFIDTHEDPDSIASYVASSVFRFLAFLLESELGEVRWPSDRTYVTAADPSLSRLPEDLAPWS